ncbi:MAG TPA: AraC family transcriptional regulator [Casimicrobiaceae bacterium]
MRDSEALVVQDAPAPVLAGNPVRPRPATKIIAGAMPDPMLSSRVRGWNGIIVELHSFQELDTLVEPRDHVIAVHLAGNVTLHRTREGRTNAKSMRVDDVTITPAGPPTRWRQSGHSLVVLVRLAVDYVRRVAAEECALDPECVELQGTFGARDARIADLVRRLLAGLEFEAADSQLYVGMLACDLTIRLLREYTVATANTIWPRAGLSSHKLRKAIEFVDDNLRNDLTLDAIAAAVALSPGHFAHAFRQATGVAPHRYVLERRVERAKTLLLQSDLPITQIAQLVGCSSHSHFSVLFNRVTGVTPRQFRANA